MKKINVYVKDRNTLILDEDAKQGDYIDLSSLSNVDYSSIEALINDGADKLYNQKLAEYKAKLDAENKSKMISLEAEYKEKLAQLNNKLDTFEQLKKNDLDLLKAKLESESDKEILELNNKLDALKKEYESKLELQKSEIEKKNNDTINSLNNTISNYELIKQNEIDTLKNSYALEVERKNREFDLQIQKMKDDYNKQLLLKDEAFNSLQRQRAALNVKQTGEDLEAWCDNEVTSYMQNGLFNCTWNKDNKVVKEEGDVKGSKADYIFKVFASDKHNEDELLASVCLDMKDENPDSVNKKKNSDYYKALDNNRNKKNCKYAILVSNLETDKPNDLPIFKVLEYPDMYVVRPAYMMTLLNMIASLSKRFADLILADLESKLELKNSIDLMNEFETIKNTYLDKPLERLNKEIEIIKKNNDAIMIAAKKVDDSCDSIIKNYINIIEDKLSRFEIKLEKDYKRYEKKISVISK